MLTGLGRLSRVWRVSVSWCVCVCVLGKMADLCVEDGTFADGVGHRRTWNMQWAVPTIQVRIERLCSTPSHRKPGVASLCLQAKDR